MEILLKKFIDKVDIYRDALIGDLPTIKRLVNDIEVINTPIEIHYTLIDKIIVEFTDDSCKILNANILGSDMSQSELSLALEILNFRLGRSFDIPNFDESLNEVLELNYSKYNYNGMEYWIHNDSSINPELVDFMLSQGIQVFDKSVINSFFGQVYYRR